MTRRGDFVTVAFQGDFGKPRPALVIQASQFGDHATVTVLPITSILIDAPLIRVQIEPDAINGLQKVSQIMVDKATTVKNAKLGPVIGAAGSTILLETSRCLAVFPGIAN